MTYDKIAKSNNEFYYITKCRLSLDGSIEIDYLKSKSMLHLLHHLKSKDIKDFDLLKDSVFRYTKARKNIAYWLNKNKREYELWKLAKNNAYKDLIKSIKNKKLVNFILNDNEWSEIHSNQLSFQSFEMAQFIIKHFENAFSIIVKNQFEIIDV